MLDHRASIKALLVGFIIGLSCITQTAAQMMIIDPYNRAYTCTTTALTFLSTQTSTVDGTSFTWNNVNVGLPPCAPNFRIVVAIAGCNAITASAGNNPSITFNGTAMTRVTDDANSTNPSGRFAVNASSLQQTGDFVFTVNGGGADVTCERAAMMLWSIIVTSGTPVDEVTDASPTGDFDLSNVAATLNGPEIVGIIAQSATACDLLDPTFNGAEIVTEDTNGTLETALSYRGGSFISTATDTTDDYANISCGTETDAFAVAVSFPPPG